MCIIYYLLYYYNIIVVLLHSDQAANVSAVEHSLLAGIRIQLAQLHRDGNLLLIVYSAIKKRP